MTDLIRLAEEHNSLLLILIIINLECFPVGDLLPDRAAANQHLLTVIISSHSKVWIVRSWSELVPGHHKEYQGGNLFKHRVQPLVLKIKIVMFIIIGLLPYLKRNSDPEKIDNDPGEVHIAHHHGVEVPEQLQLLQTDCSLSISVLCILTASVLRFLTPNTIPKDKPGDA